MTPEPFPIRIGKITFKDRKGPTTDVRRKEAIRTFAKLMQVATLSSYSKSVGKGAGE